METKKERMSRFQLAMSAHGFYTPAPEMLIPGKRLFMVEVDQYLRDTTLTPSLFATEITLDAVPVQDNYVYYHCTMPAWDGQCFVGLDSFCANGHRNGSYENDTRFLVKVRTDRLLPESEIEQARRTR